MLITQRMTSDIFEVSVFQDVDNDSDKSQNAETNSQSNSRLHTNVEAFMNIDACQ